MIERSDVILLVARLLLALMFVVSAIDKFRLERLEMELIATLQLPAPALLLRFAGICLLLGAAALVLGVYARVASFALALFVGFVSLFFLRFWSFEGPPAVRASMRNTFVGNFAVIGGLIYVATLGPGGIALADF
ncbi:MAG TPA: DoxX family membrane protein [Steroidobacteraceae bacterium]